MSEALKELAFESQLITIAKGLEKEHVCLLDGKAFYHCNCVNPQRYNPFTNNDQMVEIIEKLRKVSGQGTLSFGLAYLLELEDKAGGWEIKGEGKTINEAVCNTAYEHYKG